MILKDSKPFLAVQQALKTIKIQTLNRVEITIRYKSKLRKAQREIFSKKINGLSNY